MCLVVLVNMIHQQMMPQRVEVATYLLGSGGVVDIQLGDDFNQLYLERSQSEQEEKDTNDDAENVKKESEEERVERETLFQNKTSFVNTSNICD